MSTDHGLQPERTSLAWRRTGLAAVVAALALARGAVVRGSVAIALVSVVVAVVAAATLLQGIGQHGRATRPPEPVVLPRAAHATVLVTVTVSCAGLVLVVAA